MISYWEGIVSVTGQPGLQGERQGEGQREARDGGNN